MICVSEIMLHALKLTHCCMSVISQHNWKQKNKTQASWPQNLLAEGRGPVVTVELNAAGLGLLWTFIEHFLWASLVTQLVKNPPAMWETWVQSLGWEDPLEREWQSTPVFWPEEFHGLYSPWGQKESDTTERLSRRFTSCASQDASYLSHLILKGKEPDTTEWLHFTSLHFNPLAEYCYYPHFSVWEPQVISSLSREFPAGAMVRTHSHCQGPGFNPWLGN